MANIKFFVRPVKSKEAKIQVRIYYGRLFDTAAPIGKLIDPEKWNNKTGIIKQRTVFEGKDDLENDLKNLREHLIMEFNNVTDKTIITGDWLKTIIDKYRNPDKYVEDSKTLFGHIQNFINNSLKRTNSNGDPVCYKMRREYEVTFSYLKVSDEESIISP